MPLIDISPLIHPGIAVWPGDTPYSRVVNLAIAQGHNIDLSEIHGTVHLGAHTDAPCHYAAGGCGIDERPLEYYLGDCLVVAVAVGQGERIYPRHLPADFPAQLPGRVLFKTGTYPDPDHFNRDFASLSPELIALCHDRGAVLVGLDTPSIDPEDSKDLPSHRAVAERDMAILEGVVLHHVEPGPYELIALPLKLQGADASPVRAVLRR
ncbi:MAG TPA: cyclase family protein [bacterium]|nr:cyclase family protein [bacterium]